ncbi:MAG: 2-phosphoglycolate phosphatase [Nevskia sp.]|nr:2-phosphoglycolate phosphatase [Nevskia sp.]
MSDLPSDPMKLHPACVLFDLDGTLVDTAPDLAYAANQVRIEQGLTPLPVSDYRSSASGGARGMLKVALDIEPEHVGYAERKESFLHHYRSHLAHDSRLFPGVADLLQRLQRHGIRWGIVTNKVSSLTQPLIDALDLRRQAACIVCGDCTPNPKPAPDPILLAAQQSGFAARDCIYVGDDLRDIQAGAAAGMRTVAAAWGYLGLHPNPHDWSADVVVDTPAELFEMIDLRRAA